MDKMQQQLDRMEAVQEGMSLMLSVIITMLTKRPEDRAFIKQAIENLVSRGDDPTFVAARLLRASLKHEYNDTGD